LEVCEYFKDLSGEFFDLEIDKHPDYKRPVYVFSLTYPAYQAQEYAIRIMQFCVETQNRVRAMNWFDEWIKNN
jgi:hypothetical protein